MEAIKIIQQLFGNEVDEETLKAASETCREMLEPFVFNLEFYLKDRKKLKFVQSQLKQARQKIADTGIMAACSLDLYEKHVDIEFSKLENDQPFNIPLIFEGETIFKHKIIHTSDFEEDDNRDDHIVCAYNYALQKSVDFIVWIMFFLELKELEVKIKGCMVTNQQKALPEKTSSENKYSDAVIIEMEEEISGSATRNQIPTKYLQIFKEGGAELFCYLQTKYTKDNNHPVAKYSYIYRFLVREQLINLGCQSNYMELIEETIHTKMSKIFPESSKYEDDILPLLNHLRRDFKKRNKKEMN